MNLEIASQNALTAAMLLDTAADVDLGESYRYWDDAAPRGWVAREMKKHFRGVKVSSGVYRTAVIFDDYVVKWSRDLSRQRALVNEARFIEKMKGTKYARHFPDTRVLELGRVFVVVQELIPNVDARAFLKFEDAVISLGNRLGIDDVHPGNYGWKGPKGREYPVFIDVDLRHSYGYTSRSPRPRRSWEV